MIPLLDLRAQYAGIKSELDAAVRPTPSLITLGDNQLGQSL